MLTARLPGGSIVPVTLILRGVDAGSVRYPHKTVVPLDQAADRITGGDPDDLARAAAVLRAKAWWLGPASSLRARREADRLAAMGI
jgi:hypothetical protein